jgi:predicted amidohydrolase
MRQVRIAFLHVAPIACDLDHNRRLIESALDLAAEQGADWVVTPELCIPGYLFQEQIGTDWILPQPDDWMRDLCRRIKEHGVTVFLSQPERDADTNQLYNTVFVINPRGEIIGKHSKVKTLQGAEAWSTAGKVVEPIECDGVKVGILICADAYKNEVAQVLKDKGAELLVSPSSWGPGRCGPDGEWERRTLDTGLPIMVCNRSGVEKDELDYSRAESVVAQEGERLMSAWSENSVVLSFNWDLENMTLLSEDFQRAYLTVSVQI